MKEKFLEIYTANIHREGAEELLLWLEKSDFFSAPASSKYHGDHEGGLCEHSVNVFNETVRLLKAYPEIKATDETVAIVSLLHDICKIGCYKVEMRNRKNETTGQWEKYPYYAKGEDFNYGGHGSKSVFLVERYIRLTEEEAVAINCHMSCWGGDMTVGAAFEQFPLAWVLHAADEAATYFNERKVKE